MALPIHIQRTTKVALFQHRLHLPRHCASLLSPLQHHTHRQGPALSKINQSHAHRSRPRSLPIYKARPWTPHVSRRNAAGPAVQLQTALPAGAIPVAASADGPTVGRGDGEEGLLPPPPLRAFLLEAPAGNASWSPARLPSDLNRMGRQRLSSCSRLEFWKWVTRALLPCGTSRAGQLACLQNVAQGVADPLAQMQRVHGQPNAA